MFYCSIIFLHAWVASCASFLAKEKITLSFSGKYWLSYRLIYLSYVSDTCSVDMGCSLSILLQTATEDEKRHRIDNTYPVASQLTYSLFLIYCQWQRQICKHIYIFRVSSGKYTTKNSYIPNGISQKLSLFFLIRIFIYFG